MTKKRLYEYIDEMNLTYKDPFATANEWLYKLQIVGECANMLYKRLQSDEMCDENQVVDLLMAEFGLAREE